MLTFLWTLRRRRLALIACALIVPALGWIALSRVVPRYTATATVMYDPPEFALRELQSILRVDPTTEAVMASQAEIVRSLKTAERIADRFDLWSDPEFNPALRPHSLLTRLLNALPGSGSRALPEFDFRELTIQTVQDAITVKPVKASRLLEVSFTAPGRALAADAANFAADLYIGDQLVDKLGAVRRASQWLRGRVTELREEVRAAEDRIAAYRGEHGLVQGVQAGLATEQVSRLSTDLLQARDDRAQAGARLVAARGEGGPGASQAAVSISVVQARSRLQDLSAQLRATETRLGPAHPAVIALRGQAAEAARGVAAETARVVAAGEAETRAAQAKVAALERDLREARDRIALTAREEIPLNAMERDAEAARALLRAVLERVQQTAQQAAVETPDARLISAALPPVRPSSPKTALLMAAAAGAGVFLGLLLVHALELADTTFRSGDELRAALGLPCLALLPRLPQRSLGRRGSVEDHAARHPQSPLAEQLRALRAGLWLGKGPAKVVAITAARPAEGKTTLALALGRVAARGGERVLAVDCDIRRPSFATRLGGAAGPGIAECLEGTAALRAAIRPDTLSDMDWIAAGEAGPGEAAALPLIGSDAMGRVLRALRPEYDLILLDVPPVFAIADARMIARAADAVVVCVRWRDTPRALARTLLELLGESGAKVTGTVLTRVDMRVHARSGFTDAEIGHRRYAGYFRG